MTILSMPFQIIRMKIKLVGFWPNATGAVTFSLIQNLHPNWMQLPALLFSSVAQATATGTAQPLCSSQPPGNQVSFSPFLLPPSMSITGISSLPFSYPISSISVSQAPLVLDSTPGLGSMKISSEDQQAWTWIFPQLISLKLKSVNFLVKLDLCFILKKSFKGPNWFECEEKEGKWNP